MYPSLIKLVDATTDSIFFSQEHKNIRRNKSAREHLVNTSNSCTEIRSTHITIYPPNHELNPAFHLISISTKHKTKNYNAPTLISNIYFCHRRFLFFQRRPIISPFHQHHHLYIRSYFRIVLFCLLVLLATMS